MEELPSDSALMYINSEYEKLEVKSTWISQEKSGNSNTTDITTFKNNVHLNPVAKSSGSRVIRRIYLFAGNGLWEEWIPSERRITDLQKGLTLSINNEETCDGMKENLAKLWNVSLLISGEKEWTILHPDCKEEFENITEVPNQQNLKFMMLHAYLTSTTKVLGWEKIILNG